MFPASHRQAVRLLQGGILGMVLAFVVNLAFDALTTPTIVIAALSGIAIAWALAWLIAHPVRRNT